MAVKELSHLILSDPEYMTADPGELIELMIYEETAPLDGEAPLDMVADMWAKLAAHEFLFPHDMRPAAKARVEKDGSHFAVAQEFGVPEHVIEWSLRDDYDAVCQEIWEELNKN